MNAEVPYGFGPHGAGLRRKLQLLALAAGLLAVCFAFPLQNLIKFSLHSNFFSYIPLVPFISGYLIWTDRKRLNFEDLRPCWPGAALGAMAGAAIMAGYGLARSGGWTPVTQDYLTVMVSAMLCFFWGLCLATMGFKLSAQMFFPLAFLAFAVPMPASWQDQIDTFFQYTSAATTEGMCDVIREPLVRQDLILHFLYGAGFNIRVAPECSGIHSTLVLLMTSFLAGHLFLRRYWTKAVLVLLVVPLAILRNGFRVLVIGWLCVHVSPTMIDSPIHHQGGPIFFAMSLIPFFFVLVFLRRQDAKTTVVALAQPQS